MAIDRQVKKRKTFRLATLGCRTNQYETQAYRDQLLGLGYCEVNEGEEADVCIVNTCTVTENANRSSCHTVRKLVRQNPAAQIFVTGCAAESDSMQDLGIPFTAVSNADKERLVPSLIAKGEAPPFRITHFAAHTRAFVKVQDGCNSFCSYCILPYVRGRSRSRSISDIVSEVEGLVDSGYKEVVITGINVGDFDGGLPSLIRAVDRVQGLQRLRVSSIDPDEVDDDLMDAILSGTHTCHNLHIVLQSGSNVILKRMGRKYTRQMFLATIDKLRAASSTFTFTTDVIVGFAGETHIDFEETVAVMKDVCFAKVHVFPFSRRKRTRAASFADFVPREVVDQRKSRLLRLAEEQSYRLRQEYVGRTVSVLPEQKDGGHTDNFLFVILPQGKYPPNRLVSVRIVDNLPEGLVGV